MRATVKVLPRMYYWNALLIFIAVFPESTRASIIQGCDSALKAPSASEFRDNCSCIESHFSSECCIDAHAQPNLRVIAGIKGELPWHGAWQSIEFTDGTSIATVLASAPVDAWTTTILSCDEYPAFDLEQFMTANASGVKIRSYTNMLATRSDAVLATGNLPDGGHLLRPPELISPTSSSFVILGLSVAYVLECRHRSQKRVRNHSDVTGG